MTVYLNRIGLAVPPYDVHETFVRFGRDGALCARRVGRSGIRHRWSSLAPADDPERDPSVDRDGFYRRGAFPGSGARMRRYEEAALPLARRAVEPVALRRRTG